MAADRPKFYEEVNPAAFKFIQEVPVNWEKSIPIAGEIGSYFVVARQDRDSADWFVGGVTNDMAHTIRMPFEFLDEGVVYVAEIYRDAEESHYRDNPLEFRIETRRMTKFDTLDLRMAPGGGFAIKLKKL